MEPISSNKQKQKVEDDKEEGMEEILVQSLLSELTFWEPISPEEKDVLIRKSQSAMVLFQKQQQQQQEQEEALLMRQQKQQKDNMLTSTSLPTMKNMRRMNAQKQQKDRTTSSKSSPSNKSPKTKTTLEELKARNTWQKANDPTTGRTYYYDVVTRQTQWEKPREIRAIEKRIKKDNRKRDEMFFREMEEKLLASLQRGEKIPNNPHLVKEGPPLEPIINTTTSTTCTNPSSSADGNLEKPSRVRTISAMNEHIIAQLNQQQHHPLSVVPPSVAATNHHLAAVPTTCNNTNPILSSSSRVVVGRPPLPNNNIVSASLPRPPTNTASAASAIALAGHPYAKMEDDNRNEGEGNNNNNIVSDNLELSPEQTSESDNNESSGSGLSKRHSSSFHGLRGIHLLSGGEEEEEDGQNHQQVEQHQPEENGGSSATTEIKPQSLVAHMRRNTVGIGYNAQHQQYHHTMEQPDIEATIEAVCTVIHAHICEQAAIQSSPSNKPQVHLSPNTVRVDLQLFSDPHPNTKKNNNNMDDDDAVIVVPTVQEIKAFYMDFYKRSQMEFDAIIMSLIYVERLIKETNGALVPNTTNWSSVILGCMILASKVWDDLSMWNIDFSNVSQSSGLSQFSLQRINQLELAILTCLNFAVAIPASEYAKYYYLLRNMMIRGGLLTIVPLSTAEANRMENKTCRYQDSKIDSTAHHPRRRQTRSVDWSLLNNNNNNSGNPASATAKVADNNNNNDVKRQNGSSTTTTATADWNHTANNRPSSKGAA